MQWEESCTFKKDRQAQGQEVERTTYPTQMPQTDKALTHIGVL